MPTPDSRPRCFIDWPVLLSTIGAIVALGVFAFSAAWAGDDRPSDDVLAKGAGLFAREWLPSDPKGPGGDGLGPFYNETSCIACHHQGGPGGAGPISTNVEIVSAATASRIDASLGPADRTAQSFVLHRFGVDPMYKAWRLRLLGLENSPTCPNPSRQKSRSRVDVANSVRSGSVMRRTLLSQRSPPALFGAGLVDAVSEDVLRAAESREFPDFPEVRGHANRLKDGRLGRFGWKAETPSLRDFVLSACANELGLEVPGHHQATSPMDPEPRSTRLDLTQEECDALVAYVGICPHRLQEARSDREKHRRLRRVGRCSRPPAARRVINLDSAISTAFTATCSCTTWAMRSATPAAITGPACPIHRPAERRAGSGVRRHSGGSATRAPYLHDGRADILEEAVALHGGEASNSAKRFFKLSTNEQLRIQAFLRSVVLHPAAAR